MTRRLPHGGLAVVGTPAARAGGEVVLLHVHHRVSGARGLPRGEPASVGSVFLSPGARPFRRASGSSLLEQDDQEDDDDDERSDTDVHAAFIPGGGSFERATPGMRAYLLGLLVLRGLLRRVLLTRVGAVRTIALDDLAAR